MSKLYTKDSIEAFILTCNRKDVLKDSIISILNQSIGQVKITVLDNCSTDGTENTVREMMQEYPNLYYYRQNQQLSDLENFKTISNIAQKDFTILFHDDNIMHPDYFKYAIEAINKFPNTAIVSSCYQEWSNPTNDNWAKASQRFDYCLDKKMFVNYLYRMQRLAYSNTIYKTQNLKDHIYDMEYYAQFGRMFDKPFVANTMKDDDGAVIFRSKRLLRYRVYSEQENKDTVPNYDNIIAYSKFAKPYMQDCWYSKFMYNIINYKQLRVAYLWGRDFTLSLEEFIQKAIDEGAGCEWTRLSILPVVGKIFVEIAHILRKFFKTKYKRIFKL